MLLYLGVTFLKISNAINKVSLFNLTITTLKSTVITKNDVRKIAYVKLTNADKLCTSKQNLNTASYNFLFG